MEILNVNPTRMELTNLKRKLATARRGHRLLKDKRDELMRIFMETVGKNRDLRRNVEEAINAANKDLALAKSAVPTEVTDVAFLLPKQEMNLEITEKNVMGVNIPEYKVTFKTENPSDIYSYGYAYTPGDMDAALMSLSSVLPDMLMLAKTEKACRLLAAETEKTRRRVNALEHVMIPRYEATIKYITMKLEENERSNVSRLMKVKDMMVKENIRNAN